MEGQFQKGEEFFNLIESLAQIGEFHKNGQFNINVFEIWH